VLGLSCLTNAISVGGTAVPLSTTSETCALAQTSCYCVITTLAGFAGTIALNAVIMQGGCLTHLDIELYSDSF